MSPARLRQVEALWLAAREKESGQRAAFLAEAAAGDEELRRDVESLLAEDRSHGDLLDWPAMEGATSLPVTGSSSETLPVGMEETAGGPPSAPDNARFLPGEVLAGRYRVVALLGRGGMGEVYRATDLVLGQEVALKFLPQSLSHDARALNSLYNEVRLARCISHPSVCRVHDIADADGLRFLTMEFIGGEDLRSLLRRIGRLPPEKAADTALTLSAGLSAAHDRGVVHRDLKPANIMIDEQGRVRITDFGVALIGRQEIRGIASGTPAYMAPEQLAGEGVSARSDIYSLGLVLLELYGGRNPFKDGSPAQLLSSKREMKPEALCLSPDVDPEIERAIMRCLEPDPRNRPSADEVVLTATIATGKTPSPELVARVGATGGLPIRIAAACLTGVVATLVLFALLAPRISFLDHLHIEPPDALERVARDTLSSLGVHEAVRHRVGKFGYDMDAMRDGFGSLALFFWYRTSPHWMIPYDLVGVVTPGNPPAELPGMVITKWDGAGRLLYLKAVPSGSLRSSVTPQELWRTLFAAASLPFAEFRPVESRWIPAPGWDAHGSWAGTYLNPARTPIRVEAAAWQGRPVYFEVIPEWRTSTATPSVTITHRLRPGDLTVFVVLFAICAALAHRNVRSGRGDRRGALRLALFLLAGGFLDVLGKASHVPDVSEFTLLAQTLSWAGFVTVGFWNVYMAFEPYVRRKWPHAIISWARVLSGRIRDPLVGGHILIGITVGAATVALIAVVFALAGLDSPRRPSVWVLSGSRETFSYVVANAVDAVLNGLGLLFVTCFCRVFFRRYRLAFPATVATATCLALVVEPPSSLTTTQAAMMIIPIVVAYAYLMLQVGLLAVVLAFCTTITLIALPITADLSAPGMGPSMLVLCAFLALAAFAFYSTLAGRRLVNLDR